MKDKPGARRNQGDPPYPSECLLCARHYAKGYRGHRDGWDPASALGNLWSAVAETQAAYANWPRESRMEGELLQACRAVLPFIAEPVLHSLQEGLYSNNSRHSTSYLEQRFITWQPPLPGPTGEPQKRAKSIKEAKSDDRNPSIKAHAFDTQETSSGPYSKTTNRYFRQHSSRLA